MANSASSRLLQFSNNATLQTFIRHNLLRPTVGAASVTQHLKEVSEPQLSRNLTSFSLDQKPVSYVAEILERNNGARLSMLASSGVDQSGISKIHSLPVNKKEETDDDDVDSDDDDFDNLDIDDDDYDVDGKILINDEYEFELDEDEAEN